MWHILSTATCIHVHMVLMTQDSSVRYLPAEWYWISINCCNYWLCRCDLKCLFCIFLTVLLHHWFWMSCLYYVNSRLIVFLPIIIDKLVIYSQCVYHDAVLFRTFLINTVVVVHSLLLCWLLSRSLLMFLPSHNVIWTRCQYFCMTEQHHVGANWFTCDAIESDIPLTVPHMHKPLFTHCTCGHYSDLFIGLWAGLNTAGILEITFLSFSFL